MDNVVTPDFAKSRRRLSRRRKADRQHPHVGGKWLERLGLVYTDVVMDATRPDFNEVPTPPVSWKSRWLPRLGIEYRLLYAEPTSYLHHKRVAWASEVMLMISMTVLGYCLLCLGRAQPHFSEGMLLSLASVVATILTQAKVPDLLVRRAGDSR